MKNLIFFFVLAAPSAFGFELKISESADHVLIRAAGIPLPEMGKQLKSGLTTTLVSQLLVESGGQMQRMNRTFLIYFDLWDEVYQMKMLQDGAVEKFSGKSADEILRGINTQEFRIARPPSPRQIRVSVRLSLNPISQEKVQKIRKWLAQNNVNLPSANRVDGASAKVSNGDKTGIESGASLIAGARFSGVLAQVLNSELAEENTGTWSYISKPETFSLKGGVR